MSNCESWKIDFERSTLRFRIPHARLGEITGQFDCWGGKVLVDLTSIHRLAVRIWVELSSINTGSRRRDRAILATELFDQQWEPGLEFDGDRWEIDASDRIQLVGSVGLRGFRKTVSVTVETPTLEVDSAGVPRFVCAARTSIDRRALGLRKPHVAVGWLSDLLLGDRIEMRAHLEAMPESASVVPWVPAALGGLRRAMTPQLTP